MRFSLGAAVSILHRNTRTGLEVTLRKKWEEKKKNWSWSNNNKATQKDLEKKMTNIEETKRQNMETDIPPPKKETT